MPTPEGQCRPWETGIAKCLDKAQLRKTRFSGMTKTRKYCNEYELISSHAEYCCHGSAARTPISEYEIYYGIRFHERENSGCRLAELHREIPELTENHHSQLLNDRTWRQSIPRKSGSSDSFAYGSSSSGPSEKICHRRTRPEGDVQTPLRGTVRHNVRVYEF